MNDKLTVKIGLEIHIQLSTQRKMFCLCSNKGEDEEPNKFVCPICLGMPGTLPIPNIEAIKSVLKLGLALGCDIAKESKFDRKHYFYPDLPKGYQISQYDMPFVKGGVVEIADTEPFKVRINRIHLEEDAGKLIHSPNFTIVDLNRAGTPLAELVSEPDIKTPNQAKLFMQELQKIVKALGVSDANMEKGHLRCDANISLSSKDKQSPIVEIKNINSFKFVEKALDYEQNRLEEEFDNFSGREGKITRGFNSKTGETYSLRSKEEAKDYRYFPEPDIPPFDLTDEKFIDIEKIKAVLPKLPSAMLDDLDRMGLSLADSKIVSVNSEILDKFLSIKSKDKETLRRIAKLLINEKESRSKSADELLNLSAATAKYHLPSNIVRDILKGNVDLDEYVSSQSGIADGLPEIIDQVLKSNSDVVAKYKSGKKETIGFLIGQAMRAAQGKANPAEIKSILENKLGGK